MKQLKLTFVIAMLTHLLANAVTVPKGTFYFDNSKTNWEQVRFLYGNSAENVTHIISLTPEADNIFRLETAAEATGQTHYFFSNTTLPDGDWQQSVTTVKDLIAGERGEMRTQTFKDADNVTMRVGATFTPSSGELYTSGSWVGGQMTSGTLPAIYINTENNAPITSKDEYLSATFYVEANGTEGCDDIADKDAPLEMQIRGRGNYTWTEFDKKPYRIKLASGQKMLGMNKSKHFVLLAGADDDMGFLRNPVGFELSRRLGVAWTPDWRPTELIINGEYLGLYFLTENIRVDKDRVSISEQDDNSDADVTGGWLVEVDNYDTDPHISVAMPDKNQDMWVTYHSPETLSAAQENYLQQQFEAIRDAVYTTDRTSTAWEALVDIYAMAKVYVAREIMQDEEGFHGSFYLYKDNGAATRWMAGPVWDFGNAFRNPTTDFTWDRPNFECFLIDQIYQFPRFREAVRNVFGDFYRNQYPTLGTYVDDTADLMAEAATADHERWPQYGTADMAGKASEMKSKLNQKIAWLAEQWGTDGTMSLTGISAPDAPTEVYDIMGRRIARPQSGLRGIYIIRQGNKVTKRAF